MRVKISDVRKVLALIGSAIFLVIAPGVVAGYVPWTISRWEFEAPFLGLTMFRFAGGALTALGIAGLLECFGRFALQGAGTPAPVFPTRHLVVRGMYHHVRNPMYIAGVATILGQGLLFGNVAVIEYGAIVWLLVHLFVLLYEEPTLRASFGAEYESFCAQVPRWIPRLTRPPVRRAG
jgi:protein-S-isoprenylcysteine O-methyltransferase Ste14